MDVPKLDRAELRRRQRKADEFAKRKTFTPDEVRQMNLDCYEFGGQHVLEAVKEIYGLGETRLQRIRDRVAELQRADFGGFEETGNVGRAVMNRDRRRAFSQAVKAEIKKNSKKVNANEKV